jgi:thymidylate synthase
MIKRVRVSCSCSFSELPLIKLRVSEMHGLMQSENFTANGVELSIEVAPEHIELLQRQLADISRGRIVLTRDER